MGMGTLVAKTNLKRKPNYLYYVKSYNEDGDLGIFEAKMTRGKKKKDGKKE